MSRTPAKIAASSTKTVASTANMKLTPRDKEDASARTPSGAKQGGPPSARDKPVDPERKKSDAILVRLFLCLSPPPPLLPSPHRRKKTQKLGPSQGLEDVPLPVGRTPQHKAGRAPPAGAGQRGATTTAARKGTTETVIPPSGRARRSIPCDMTPDPFLNQTLNQEIVDPPEPDSGSPEATSVPESEAETPSGERDAMVSDPPGAASSKASIGDASSTGKAAASTRKEATSMGEEEEDEDEEEEEMSDPFADRDTANAVEGANAVPSSTAAAKELLSLAGAASERGKGKRKETQRGSDVSKASSGVSKPIKKARAPSGKPKVKRFKRKPVDLATHVISDGTLRRIMKSRVTRGVYEHGDFTRTCGMTVKKACVGVGFRILMTEMAEVGITAMIVANEVYNTGTIMPKHVHTAVEIIRITEGDRGSDGVFSLSLSPPPPSSIMKHWRSVFLPPPPPLLALLDKKIRAFVSARRRENGREEKVFCGGRAWSLNHRTPSRITRKKEKKRWHGEIGR